MALSPGTKLGPYEILSPLGAGGMGEVYRAKDSRLAREVAIKVLPDATARDSQALARFDREAKAVAALSHPNILAIHDVGREHGISFVVTELLEGETLRERLRRSAIAWRKVVEIGLEVADGLSAAHAKGIIHRDLKPENLFITSAGHTKILDFGLAHVAPDPTVAAELRADTPTMTLDTRPGTILGTVNYMSPEQISGRATDPRTDIFSFGCVLYEMISGRRAFGGESVAEITTAILRDEPPTLSDSGRDVPIELDRLIARCHEKKPEQRIQSARDLGFALRDLLSDSGHSKRPATNAGRRTRTMLVVQLAVGVVAVAALLLTLNAGGWRGRLFRQTQVGSIRSLVVLPLENLSGDPEQEYFADAMTDAIIDDLAKISALRVTSRTTAMRYKNTPMTLPQIARELGVDGVVEGSATHAGDRVQVKARLIEAATEKQLWGERYNREMRDILSIQSEVARTIAQEIKVTLTPQEQARLTAARPVIPKAQEAYMRGRFHWHTRTRTGMLEAIKHFHRAIELDPQYAPAYAGTADAHTHLARHGHVSPKEAFPLAKQAALKALELDDALAEAHGALAVTALYFDWDWTAAEHELRRALNLNESYEEAHHQYSHLLLTVGRPDESLTESRRALELNPLDLSLSFHLGWHYMMTRQYDQAIAQLKSVLDMDPHLYQALRHIGWAYMYYSLHAEAITALESATKLEPDNGQAMTALAAAYAAGGRGSDAKAILGQLEGSMPQRYVSACDIAAVYAALNEVELALVWLEKAYEERSPRMVELGLDPVFDALRSDPRFADLLRRVGLPPLQVRSGPANSPIAQPTP